MKSIKTMKSIKLTSIVLVLCVMLTLVSCKGEKKENKHDSNAYSEMNNDKIGTSNTSMDSNTQNSVVQKVLADYMALKDALVNDDNAKAKELGNALEQSLKSFDASAFSSNEKSELNDIIEDAIEHAEHIGYSDIGHQREHFKILSKDVTDMVSITGTKMKIYEQFCPMYDNNKGGAWLSMNEEIRNPYFGDKMLKCGKVQREIN